MPNDLRLDIPRLELIAGTADLVRTHLDNPEGFALQLGATAPRISPPPPDVEAVMESMAQALEKRPEEAGWWCWYFVLHDRGAGQRVLIGNGGFKGPPDAEGTVEIGYSLLPQFRDRGYATEAVRALVAWASEDPRVKRVIAETARDNAASIRILDKAGFVQRGKGSEEALIRLEKVRQDHEGR
jgi:ribosomal-protein-alanine N-acetyltransferase